MKFAHDIPIPDSMDTYLGIEVSNIRRLRRPSQIQKQERYYK